MTKNKTGIFYLLNSLIKLFIFFLIVITFMNPLYANNDRGCPQHRRKMHNRPPLFHDPVFLRNKLGMSDSQITKLEKINKEHRKRMELLRDQIEPHRAALRDYLIQEKVDLKKVRVYLEKISDIEVEIRLSIIKHQMDVESILTPEMRKKLKEERRGRMRRMR